MLDIAKASAGRLSVEVTEQPIASVVTSALSRAMPLAKAKDIDLRETDGDRALLFAGDPERVRQILVNLLGNAVKFTPRGGHVRVSWGGPCDSDGGKRVWIRVTDSGVGIAPRGSAAHLRAVRAGGDATPSRAWRYGARPRHQP